MLIWRSFKECWENKNSMLINYLRINETCSFVDGKMINKNQIWGI